MSRFTQKGGVRLRVISGTMLAIGAATLVVAFAKPPTKTLDCTASIVDTRLNAAVFHCTYTNMSGDTVVGAGSNKANGTAGTWSYSFAPATTISGNGSFDATSSVGDYGASITFTAGGASNSQPLQMITVTPDTLSVSSETLVSVDIKGLASGTSYRLYASDVTGWKTNGNSAGSQSGSDLELGSNNYATFPSSVTQPVTLETKASTASATNVPLLLKLDSTGATIASSANISIAHY